jgi:hypothetical protein
MAWIEHIGLIFLIRAKLQQIQYCATKSISFLAQKPKKNAQTPQKRAKDSKLKVFLSATILKDISSRVATKALRATKQKQTDQCPSLAISHLDSHRTNNTKHKVWQ